MGKIKTILFGILFSVMTVAVNAQESNTSKYEYAIVRQVGATTGSYVAVSVEGQELVTRKISVRAMYPAIFDNRPLFEEVAKLQSEGWAVTNQQELENNTVTYFLRRKKQ